MATQPQLHITHTFRARVHEFAMPPIQDALVLGKRSPIGCTAFRKALALIVAQPFTHIEVKDDVIGDILVREAIVRRFPTEKLIPFILERIKPLMGPEEVLHLNLTVEVHLEEESA